MKKTDKILKAGKPKPTIRPVRFSLKLKVTILVFILMIITVSTVSNFIIRLENNVVDSQLEDTMRVYLETFRKNVEIMLFQKNDKDSLNQFLVSYKKIKNFEMAMFVDNSGKILVHTEPYSVGMYVAKASLSKFKSVFEDRVYIDRFERAREDLPENISGSDFEQNILKKIKSVSDKAVITAVYEKEKNGFSYQLKDEISKHDKWEANRILGNIGYQKWQGYDGFLPIFHPLMQANVNDAKKIGDMIALYKSGKLFKTEPMPEEERNNFELIHDFDKLTDPLIGANETNIKTVQTKLKSLQFKPSDLEFLKGMKSLFEDYKDSEAVQINGEKLFRLMELLKVLGLAKDKSTQYLAAKDKGLLFTHSGQFSKSTRPTLQFIRFLEKFIFNNIDNNGQPTAKWKMFTSQFKAKPGEKKPDITETAGFSPEDSLQTFRRLLTFYRLIEPYRYKSISIDTATAEKAFSEMRDIYRIGTVRIVLNMEKIQIDKQAIINNTIDIAVMVIFRILVVTFLIVAGLVASLSRLSAGTDAIAKGNLDEVINIASSDEIGQLADKFNLMTRNLKKAFNEVKDKARMEAELNTAKEIQAAILPKQFPAIPNYSFSAYYQPQTESGGDYYDFIEVDESHIGIVVADVTGHGVGAGMVMAMLRSALRTNAKMRVDASKVIKDINPILFRDTLPNMFATVFYGVLDFQKNEVFYSLAGHCQGVIYNPKDKSIKLMKASGMPVGMVDSAIFDPSVELFKISLGKGDIFIQYTDGITEAKSPSDEEYGEDRFYEAIRQNADGELDKMRDGIIADVRRFAGKGEQSDDITLLLMALKK